MISKPTWFQYSVYANGFILGFALMGFEMLGSRYLNPYFGSGIVTWAALISTVLAALMAGYFLGGNLVDRNPHPSLLGWLLLAAATYLLALPYVVDPAIASLLGFAGDGAVGVIVAAMSLIFVPLTLIATYSPFGVRLLLATTEQSGRVTGLVYGISTFGNIVGTLTTTFVLIPIFGTRMITVILAIIVALCGLSLLLLGRLMRSD